MVRTNQGGSILGFVILAGVMALLLIGGVYFVRHTLAPVEKGSKVAVTDKQGTSSNQNPATDTKQSPADTKDKDKDSHSTEKTTGTSSTSPTGNNQPAVTPQPSPVVDNKPSSGLPKTGPSGVLFVGFMLSGLSALLMIYVQSRRLPSSL